MVNWRNDRGGLMIELMVALAILMTAVLPLGMSVAGDQRICRAYYFHAVAMEIVDGEMEVLAAGEWRAFKDGEQVYAVHAAAAQNLPPGRFVLTVQAHRLRLEWRPDKLVPGGPVVREVVMS